MNASRLRILLVALVALVALAVVDVADGDDAEAELHADLKALHENVREQAATLRTLREKVREKAAKLKQYKRMKNDSDEETHSVAESASVDANPTMAASKSFDWTQCKSEGGQKECARCSGSKDGALPCHEVPIMRGTTGRRYADCSDDDVWKGKYFYQFGTPGKCKSCGTGSCLGFENDWALSGVAATTERFPVISDEKARGAVITKAFVTHPNKASKHVGLFMMKRVVLHACTGKTTACKANTRVADVMKIGYCINCPEKKYPHCKQGKCSVFQSENARAATDEMRKAFSELCLPVAFNTAGGLKKPFQCSVEDQKLADFVFASF